MAKKTHSKEELRARRRIQLERQLETQKKAEERRKRKKSTNTRICVEGVLTAEVKAESMPSKTRRPKINKRNFLDYQRQVIAIFGIHRRLSAEDIATHLELDFSRDSKDREKISEILQTLTKSGLLVNNGGNYVQPYRAQPDSEKLIVGVVKKGPDGAYVEPADAGLNRVLLGDACNVPTDTIVTVRPTDDFNSRAKIISEHGSFETAEGIAKLVALAAGIPIEFPDDVLKEALNLSVPPVSDTRKDMRHIPFITIDPKTAKDFDDAICVRRISPKKRQVHVAIADVAHYIKPGSRLWEESLKRGNSTYLPGLTIPMTPEAISNELCSLKPNVDRAAFVMTLEIDNKGKILKYESHLALIKSKARLTYEQVQEAIEGKSQDKDVVKLYNRYISKALDAYKVLLNEREERGALDLNVKEQRIDVTRDNGLDITLERSNESHGLIEELMILANRGAYRSLLDQGGLMITRAHGEPNEKLLREKIPELEKWGMVIDPDMSAAEMVHDIAAQAKGHENEDRIKRTLIRVQAMAGYKAESAPHFALALQGYTHFTSPIRRGADLIAHHLLQGGQQRYPEHFTQENLVRWVEHLNMTERRSEEAERECNKRFAAKWVAGQMGQKFNARVIAIGEHEMSVRVSSPSITTDIALREGMKPFAVGEDIQIVPTKADAITGIIEFKLAGKGDVPQNRANDNAKGVHPATGQPYPSKHKSPRKMERRFTRSQK